MEPKCEACRDTGFYGDIGPGIRGNREYNPCDQCTAVDRARRRKERETKRSERERGK
jgi:hypothetical protein